MAISNVPVQTASAPETNGSAMAAFMGVGVGSFAMGVLVILNEAGIFAAPPLYAPAGGVTGRTTLATIAWLIGWGLLHYRWKGREIAPARVFPITLVLIALGILATFPPLWKLL